MPHPVGLGEGVKTVKKAKLLVLGLAAATTLSIFGVSQADIKAPGQCKKQQSNCNGNSECAPPHLLMFPIGQQKKC
jgi:hypothetical protein